MDSISGDYDDPGPDNTLGPSESLDSDIVRNDDGDIVVDPPERWIATAMQPEQSARITARLIERRFKRVHH